MIAQCTCGNVVIEADGEPIASSICYCDTCQEGSAHLEALQGAARVLDSDHGTGYSLYRIDRVRYAKGAHALRDLTLPGSEATLRSYAGCCNTAMLMRFSDGRHWVAIYRARIQGAPPPLQYRICTRFRPKGTPLPTDVPSDKMYPPGLILKLLGSRLAMLLRGGPLR